MKHTVLFIFGTRPEAIKLCPVIRYLQAQTSFDVCVCVTAQHREMLDQILQVFGIVPDYDLGAMRPGQTLVQVSSRILTGLEPVLARAKPAMAIVQGDTTTTLCGALAAFYAGVPVAHIEAGLRTGDVGQPFPEEMNRVLVTRLSSLHLAATEGAAQNLLAEGVPPANIHITGNTGVDAVRQVASMLESGALTPSVLPAVDPSRKCIVVTAHRRESFGAGFDRICQALALIAERPDVQIVFPVHRNPNVVETVHRKLGHYKNIILTDPLDYVSFVSLMQQAWLILTDSGGIQEEASSLGKPILVMREKTERPEAVNAGTATLVGTSVEKIVSSVTELLQNQEEYSRRALVYSPYGDGRASQRVATALTVCLNEVSRYTRSENPR